MRVGGVAEAGGGFGVASLEDFEPVLLGVVESTFRCGHGVSVSGVSDSCEARIDECLGGGAPGAAATHLSEAFMGSSEGSDWVLSSREDVAVLFEEGVGFGAVVTGPPVDQLWCGATLTGFE